MKKIIKFLVVVFFASITLIACNLSTDELTKEVIKSMNETEDFKNNSIKINSLILTKKSGNEYNGVLETSEPNGSFSYSVEVIYDGNNMTWRIIE